MSIANKLISSISARVGNFPNGKLLFLLSVLACPLTYGEENPIYLRAEHIAVNQNTGESIYKGNVRLQRGEFSFIADKAFVTQRNSRIDSLIATGNPIVVKKHDRKKNTLTIVNGQRLFYLAKYNLAVVTGEVITRRGNDVIKSAKVTYKIDDDIIVAEGRGDAARVHALFQIKSLTAQTPGPEKSN